jgi:hypothetical protein
MRVVHIFPNADACLGPVTALCVEQSEEWVSQRRYVNMGGSCPGLVWDLPVPS